ncbi:MULTISPECIES: FadR/GntR family transcriptional regulator [Mycolicibacterium]|jgi:DNA-binding FadR family transcriptional regulator|uniref:FadR family transcriptional regulator n=1 Tax=Mycolicibacterium mucogenicum TaxID=56689 RepID=A0A4R5WAN4_MYCMU|nr:MULTISPECIES: FadR/GntR family transcriptional regulator [Mycolicibacterium]TDK86329.1 FadR family transcriptional regulator [Mycolicibacterium mucogenicum]TXH27797.1 MAG: FadR family transcriptional regulator [Mycobacterium sp.]GCB01459.1 GntR family transcriptional regulator [Mycolicibacterium sp. NCC-Tsukiji]
MVSQVTRQPLAAQAAQLLLTRIKDGEWLLGQRLPGETTLAAQLGVGRSTLREAIRELAGKGVLDSRQGAGVFVTALDVTDDWDTVLRSANVASVIEARIAIEAEGAALAATRRTPADLRTIRRTLAARGVTGQSVPEHVDADMAFHRAVIAAAHNDVLTQLFDAFLPRLRLAMIDMLKIRPIASEPCDHALHQQLADAIVARDPDAAAAASRTHLSALKESFT